MGHLLGVYVCIVLCSDLMLYERVGSGGETILNIITSLIVMHVTFDSKTLCA